MIHKTAIIESNVEIGEGTNVWAFVQIREGVKIGKNCTIGNGSFIDPGIIIGNNVQIMSKALIHRGVEEIEDDVFVGPIVCFINDKNPRNYSQDITGTAWRVKKGASVGAGVLVMADVNIGRYSLVGAGSIVTKDVPDHGLVYGLPAKLMGFVCFCGKRINLKNYNESKETVNCDACGKEVFIKKEYYDQCKKSI